MMRKPLARTALAAIACLCVLVAGCAPAERSSHEAGPQQAGPATATTSAEAVAGPIATKSGVEMMRIPAGEFLMGSEDGDDDEKPVHPVRVSAFLIDVTEVTQESFERLMGRNPSRFKGADRPVDQVNWHDAVQYCNVRSLREGLKRCYDPQTLECDFEADGYRLPTEAEWEYACRAGTTTGWSFGDDPGSLDKHAWVKEDSKNSTHPVREKRPNPWGLYDVHGNVAEWCNDYYSESYPSEDEVTDPRGPATGENRVVRGGCWATGADRCRSSARGFESPGFVDVCFRRDAYGFRCVRRVAEDAPQTGRTD
jgi:formylglycine-generating enzyme required for sulfatase activity